MFGKVLGVMGFLYYPFAVHAVSFVVQNFPYNAETQLKYVKSISGEPVKLQDVLREYGYEGAILPQSVTDLSQYLEMYSNSNEYMLSCDGSFLAPIKSTIWAIKFSLVYANLYPNEAIKRLKSFCTLIKPEGDDIDFKNFLIKVLFQQNGLCDLYSDMKRIETTFKKSLSLSTLRSDFNSMLDIVDPDEQIDRFKK